MSRSNLNVVTVEFRAIGTGLDQIEADLKKLRTTSASTSTAGASLNQLAAGAGNAARGISGVADAAAGAAAPVEAAAGGIEGLVAGFTSLGAAVPIAGVALLAAAVALDVVTIGTKKAVDAIAALVDASVPKAEALRLALEGLSSVAAFRFIDPAAAQATVANLGLVQSGLLSTTEAALALRNLLAKGFTLEQSTRLLESFGDSAAFAGKSADAFGAAVIASTESTKGGVDSIAEYNSILEQNAVKYGAAARATEGYAGQITRIDAAYKGILEQIGSLIENNVALGNVLVVVADAVELVNKDFDGFVALIGVLTPLLQAFATVVLAPIGLAIGGIATAAGAALEATASLATISGVGDITENNKITQLGDDIRQLGLKTAETAAKMPGDIAKIKDAAASLAATPGGFNPAAVLGPVLTATKTIQTLAHAITEESARRAQIEEDAAKRQEDAFARALDLERQRQSIIAHTAIATSAPGRNPLAVQFDDAQLKLQEDAAKRLADELDRLAEKRRDVLTQIVTEQAKQKPDTALISGLRSSLNDLDVAAATFAEVARTTTDAQEQALRVDFVNKFADQLQKANAALFDVIRAVHDDNPFVAIFTAASTAVENFKRTFGDTAAGLAQFQASVDELARKQAARATIGILNENFGLSQRQAAFAAAADIGPLRDTADAMREIFDQFERLKGVGGEEGFKAAAKFLTDAATAGQLDINLLLPSQANEVFQAFTDLQTQIASQKAEAKRLAEEDAQNQKRIEAERQRLLQANSDALGENLDGLDALAVVVDKLRKEGFARFEITMGAEETIKNIAVSGTGAHSDS